MNDFQKAWKELAARKTLTSSDMAALCLIKAILREQRHMEKTPDVPFDMLEQVKFYLRKSFKPISKPSKLSGGAYPYGSLYLALRSVVGTNTYSNFKKFYNQETWIKVEELLKQVQSNRYGQVNL